MGVSGGKPHSSVTNTREYNQTMFNVSELEQTEMTEERAKIIAEAFFNGKPLPEPLDNIERHMFAAITDERESFIVTTMQALYMSTQRFLISQAIETLLDMFPEAKRHIDKMKAAHAEAHKAADKGAATKGSKTE